jgi:hypothetical protein
MRSPPPPVQQERTISGDLPGNDVFFRSAG